ncbi:MAG: hypothetical protein DHS20C04_09070 [Hyphococcus sp.]|nr:MAG: hypothetical protein DHS20C04_09070 [Marinicaulis sp.]
MTTVMASTDADAAIAALNFLFICFIPLLTTFTPRTGASCRRDVLFAVILSSRGAKT